MKILLHIAAILLLTTCTPLIEAFYWLEGTWEMPAKNGVRYEKWERKNTKSMTGISYKINGQDSTLLEKIKIEVNSKGIWYIPTVPDQNESKPVSFKLTKREGQKFTFENLEHDFPQRIIYEFRPLNENYVSAGDTLHARVEGMMNGNLKGIDFRFFRK